MSESFAQYSALAREYNLVPVAREIIADTETPVSALEKFADAENVFLLESVEGGETWGRYSFIGVEPRPFLEAEHGGGGAAREGARPLEALREIYRGVRPAVIPGLPRFIGGAVGFLAFEAAREFERLPLPKQAAGIATRSRFMVADELIVFDNLRHTAKIVVCSRPDGPGGPAAAYEAARARIDAIEAALRAGAPARRLQAVEKPVFASNMAPEQFKAMVARAREFIIAGDVIQVVLSQRFTAGARIAPLEAYRALRLLNPSPYMYFLKTGGRAIVGSSPEVMARLTGNRLELRPIAGTRPRGRDEQEDRRLADELLSDEKEKAEHVMLVDLGRNDVGRVSEIGSVQVRDYMCVERYSHVMHLVSRVEGILRKDKDAFDALKAVFPAGTLTGAPKIRAMEIIRELEPQPRGVYGGALGYVGYDGNMDFAITIRTLEFDNGRLSVQAGAGIVFNSDPAREYEETCHKARGMVKAAELAARGLVLDEEAAAEI